MFVVKFAGPFGFIKPWTAVRDIETYSQNFLTPSVIEGIEKKLFPELLFKQEYEKRIIRHRLTYTGISPQQEVTQPKGIEIKTDTKNKIQKVNRSRAIIKRGVLINPLLFLCFSENEYAEIAIRQHICLCRNEDVLLPEPYEADNYIMEINECDFDKPDNGFNGFELLFGKGPNDNSSFIVGYNRFRNSSAMYGRIHIVGANPLVNEEM